MTDITDDILSVIMFGTLDTDMGKCKLCIFPGRDISTWYIYLTGYPMRAVVVSDTQYAAW